MALWSVKLADETRTGLTIYQLQELIRTGLATAESEVSTGFDWKRVADVPALAKVLPEDPAQLASKDTVEVYGIQLEVGPDGKPLPPTDAQIAQMLAVDATPRQAKPSAKNNRWVMLAIGGAVLVMMLLVLHQLVAARHLALE